MCDRWFVQETDRRTDMWTQRGTEGRQAWAMDWCGPGLYRAIYQDSLTSQHEKSDITASMASLSLSLSHCVCVSPCVCDRSFVERKRRQEGLSTHTSIPPSIHPSHLHTDHRPTKTHIDLIYPPHTPHHHTHALCHSFTHRYLRRHIHSTCPSTSRRQARRCGGAVDQSDSKLRLSSSLSLFPLSQTD